MRHIIAAVVLSLCALPAGAATFTVTTSAASGPGSLTQAILDANANPGLDTITFAIGSGAQTIAYTAASTDQVTDPVIIDGTTQPGFAGTPIITLDGTSATSPSALTLIAAGSTIRGLVIGHFNTGITIFSDSNVIEGNYIGTDGTAALPNMAGVSLFGGTNNTIGGTTAASRNVISGNTNANLGLLGSASTTIRGNYVGVNAAGSASIGGNGPGIVVANGSTNTLVTGNLVSGNIFGIQIAAVGTNLTTVTGNLVGTNAAGNAAIPNTQRGISVDQGATNTLIGGTTAASRNVVSGNTTIGILVGTATTSGVLIEGNYVGTNAAGSAKLANQTGISVNTGAGVTIGGTVAGAGNVISGNTTGVLLAFSSNDVVAGNLIGTDATGMAAIPNGSGVNVTATSSSTIGGTTAGAGNVISGNTGTGVSLSSATSTGDVVAGNIIGLDASGTSALGNGQFGIFIGSAPGVVIGGTNAAARNVISANQVGIFNNGNAPGLQVKGNFIGTDAAGTANRGNKDAGALIAGPGNVQIGGTGAGEGNRIWFNNTGVVVFAGSTGVSIQRNSITASTILGIDLNGDQFANPDDPGDADMGGNNLQNFPGITSFTSSGGASTVTGVFNSTPLTTFTIDLYDNAVCGPFGFGEGATWVASVVVTTDAAGNATFSVPVPVAMTIATATATDPNGNTSEFSPCQGLAVFTISNVNVMEGTGSNTTATFTVTRTPALNLTSTVQYATSDATAVAPADYIATNGTLTFNPGDTTKTIAVTVIGDNIDEPSESFFMKLANPTGATSLAIANGLGTITDDDTSSVSIADAPSAVEGTPAVFTVTLSVPSSSPITVNFSTAAGSATGGADYTTTSGSVTFAAGQTSKTVSVPTLVDATTEAPETFFVNLTSTATIARAQAVGTIVDVSSIPALSAWMLMLLAIALAALAMLVLRR